jgi:hypothetical protein
MRLGVGWQHKEPCQKQDCLKREKLSQREHAIRLIEANPGKAALGSIFTATAVFRKLRPLQRWFGCRTLSVGCLTTKSSFRAYTQATG